MHHYGAISRDFLTKGCITSKQKSKCNSFLFVMGGCVQIHLMETQLAVSQAHTQQDSQFHVQTPDFYFSVWVQIKQTRYSMILEVLEARV